MRIFCEKHQPERNLEPGEWRCPDHPHAEPTMDIYPEDVEAFERVARDFLAKLEDDETPPA